MKARLIGIGNSRGFRIPRLLIEQCGLDKTVELRVENNRLVISSARRARHGWDDAFRVASASLDDELLLEKAASNEFDRKEWQW
ncbi:MAG TPA: hypothetical protein VNV88_09485 [Candidatus Solibacter sp.]|jgi:antitoxin MazE|nr:hypothetical protein [Candidatus Solibacter sp.]